MAAKKKVAKKVVKKAVKKAVKKVAKPAKKAVKKVAKPAKKVVKKVAKPVKAKAKRKPNAAFMRPLTPSAELAAIVGAKPLPRTQAVKKVWDYIKANKLQDTVNKRNINNDTAMKALCGGKGTISMFDLAKILGKHLA